MGKITGYDNDFTTVKQVNDALKDFFNGGTVYIEKYNNTNFEIALRTALNECPEGSTIDCTYFSGTVNVSNGFLINKPIKIILGNISINFDNINQEESFFMIKSNNVIIQGQNRNTDKNNIYTGSTIIYINNANPTENGGYHIMSKGNKNIIISDMTLIGKKTTLGRQFDNATYPIDGAGGIYIEKKQPGITEGGNTVNAIRLQNLLIDKTKAHGIYLDTPILSLLKDIRISDCGGHGVFINGGTTTLFESVYIASCQLAGFCIYGHTYGTLLNCVAENCGCGFWIRSSFNISVFNPGVESTKTYGSNPWKNSQPVTKVYGFNKKTTEYGTDNKIKILDITVDAYSYFIGHAFIISGGRNISLYGPYANNIGGSISYEAYPTGTEKSKNIRYLLVNGNNRSTYVNNLGCKDTINTANIQSFEIEINSEVKSFEMNYNVNETTLTSYTSSTPITNNKSLTAPIYCDSDDVVIRNGKNFLTPININGSTGTDNNDFIGYPFTIHMVIPNLNKFVGGISYKNKRNFTLNPAFTGYETLKGMTVKTGQTPALPYIKISENKYQNNFRPSIDRKIDLRDYELIFYRKTYKSIYKSHNEYRTNFGKRWRIWKSNKTLPITTEQLVSLNSIIKFYDPNITDTLSKDNFLFHRLKTSPTSFKFLGNYPFNYPCVNSLNNPSQNRNGFNNATDNYYRKNTEVYMDCGLQLWYNVGDKKYPVSDMLKFRISIRDFNGITEMKKLNYVTWRIL